MIEPEAGEVIVWRHSGHGQINSKPLITSKPLTERQRQRRVFIYRIIWLAGLIYWVMQPETLDFLTSGRGVITLLYIIVFFAFPKLDVFISGKLPAKPRTDGVPLWMSQQGIMFNATHPLEQFAIGIQDIKSVNPEFAMGSPSIALGLAQKTVNLMSSEADNLLKQLYILRPDLKPASNRAAR